MSTSHGHNGCSHLHATHSPPSPLLPSKDLFVENAEAIRNKHVAFLASFHNPAVIFEQISVIYALPRLFVGSFTLVLPFFPTGTLERVSHISLPYIFRDICHIVLCLILP